MDHWSRTKSRIWQGQHVLVLGWSEKTLYLLHELFEKLLSSGKTPTVVILADRDEAEMRQEMDFHRRNRFVYIYICNMYIYLYVCRICVCSYTGFTY